ncbi:MAG: YciI family protein [Bacteroidota bacterium]
MKTKYLLIAAFFALNTVYSQEVKYDENLAKSLNADHRGMKNYVFCLLTTGSNTTATDQEKADLFKGHMDNIMRLAKEGKLATAGPFGKNDRNYRGIFIFNVTTIEEAKALVESDPAVKANLLEAELTLWYASAALMKVNEIHSTITKPKN